MRDVLLEKRSFFTDPTPTYETERTDPLWDVMAETYDHLFSLDDYLYDATDIALYAASNGLTTNDGFTARFDTNTHAQDIEEELERLANGEISEGTFYLTSDESTFAYVAHKTQGLTYAVQIDWEWYAILPIVDGLEAPTASDTLYVYPLIPLMIPDYSDDHFTDGISNDDPSTITLPMNYFTKIYFGVATALIDQDGNYYDIIEYNYNYEDRFIITLDIEDASVLKGQYLASDQQTSRAVNPSEH